MMTAVKAYYDGSTFVPMQQYSFKPQQQVLIVVDDEQTEEKSKYSASLATFREKYADFLASEADGLDSVFDDVRDKTELLLGTESDEW